MPCFKHDSDDILPSVAANTEVFLDEYPAEAFTVVGAYLWKDSDENCEGHNEQIDDDDVDKAKLPANLKFTHVARLKQDVIKGFQCLEICRAFDDGSRKILYRFQAVRAHLKKDPDALETSICDG